MVDFGWSASCVLEAIKLSNKIRKALRDAGGAKEQYIEAMSFLTQFECVFKELERHISDGHGASHRDAIEQQLKLMELPWTRLQELLSKYENSLGEKSTRSKMKMAPRKVQWAIKDLDEAVGKSRDDVCGPLQTVSFLLQMQSMETMRSTNEKCQKIIDDLEAVDLPNKLQQSFARLDLHEERTRNGQQGLQTHLIQLHHTLQQQHKEILDVLQSKINALASPDAATVIEAIYKKLRDQQASLNKIHEALLCLSDEKDKSAVASVQQATAETVHSPGVAAVEDAPAPLKAEQVADAISVVRLAATATSMFLLGYYTKSTFSGNCATTPLEPKQYICSPERQPELEQHEAKPEVKREWVAEFNGGGRSRQQPHATLDQVDTEQSKPTEKYSNLKSPRSTVPESDTQQDWYCCECGDGPWNGRIISECVTCAHTPCIKCTPEDTLDPETLPKPIATYSKPSSTKISKQSVARSPSTAPASYYNSSWSGAWTSFMGAWSPYKNETCAPRQAAVMVPSHIFTKPAGSLNPSRTSSAPRPRAVADGTSNRGDDVWFCFECEEVNPDLCNQCLICGSPGPRMEE